MASRLIGVISDTHGIIRPEAVRVLQGCELIVHAGDIGSLSVIEKLRTIAPVVAVRGNCDRGDCATLFAAKEIVEVGGRNILVIHDLTKLNIEPTAAAISAVINGHTHEPYQFEQNRVLYLNPGSAGPRRFNQPVSLALLKISDPGIDNVDIEAEFVTLLR